MTEHVDLEIGLSWDRQRDEVHTYLRIDKKGSSTDQWLQPQHPLDLDLERLGGLESSPADYGSALAEMLFRPEDIGLFYRRARDSAADSDGTLHVRLHITAPVKYHAIKWETLRDPDTGAAIATQSGVLFSRYLSSSDWRPIPARPKHDLRGLVVVAAPTNIGRYSPNGQPLAEVNREAELQRARAALQGLHEVAELPAGEAALLPLLSAVEEGVDVLYLVCHGTLKDDVPQLYLEGVNGEVELVDGRTLVERLVELDHRPTVVMLCSCQSATRGDELWTDDTGELAALGPRLAAAGVAAVVAMQGDFSMETAETFGPSLFDELRKHGQVDRAMAAARRAVRDRPDWWVPVLFSRLRSGRTYYMPAFTEDADTTWEALRLAMSVGDLTPVLGPGLADSILASRQEMAAKWVDRWQMPLAPNTRGDLAQVAQFLRVRSADGVVRNQLLDHLKNEISARRDKANPGDAFWDLDVDVQKPEQAILEVGRRLRENDQDDPYRVAAALPVSVYVTTAWTNLLQEALESVGRHPVTMKFRWNAAVDPPSSEDARAPTAERPLVYHLFGHLEDKASLVLSEDDYFEWFTAWLQKGVDVPSVVQNALISRSLLFLGFRLDDWDFRVVFHAIKSFGGSERLRANQHVGVQLSAESPMIEAESAQEYLESYFGEDKVDIYWGETADFLRELRTRAEVPA